MVLAEVLEQPRTGAEKHRHEMHVNLLDATGTQQLPADIGAEHVDVLVAGGGLCLPQGFDGTVHECVHASLGHLPGHAVGNDERRCASCAARSVRTPAAVT